jgi:hypothetical protein
MPERDVQPDLESWARHIKSESERTHRKLEQDLRAMGPAALPLLNSLAKYPSGVVRGWVASVLGERFGMEAVPLLRELVRDRNRDVRDEARWQLEQLGPPYVHELLPGVRADLRKGLDPFGADKFAMFFLARNRDVDAIPIIRRMAEDKDQRHYAYRMPLVIADYIDNPASVVDRIRAHDHEWMFWLVEAVDTLGASGTDEAFEAAIGFDDECAAIIRDRPSTRRKPTGEPAAP